MKLIYNGDTISFSLPRCCFFSVKHHTAFFDLHVSSDFLKCIIPLKMQG